MTNFDLNGPWTGAALQEAKRAFPFKSWAMIAVGMALLAGIALAVAVRWPN